MAQKVTVPGTTLKIDLPAGWSIGPPPPGYPPTDVLWHDANPRYSVQVNEGVTGLATTPQEAANSSCNMFLAVMLSMPAAKTANRISRPAYFPDTYYGSVLELQALVGLRKCRQQDRRSDDQSEGRPAAAGIADSFAEEHFRSSFSGQTFIEPPGRVHLKLLDIDVLLGLE